MLALFITREEIEVIWTCIYSANAPLHTIDEAAYRNDMTFQTQRRSMDAQCETDELRQMQHGHIERAAQIGCHVILERVEHCMT